MLTVGLSGCDAPSSSDQPINPNANAKSEDFPKLANGLFELAVADAPDKVALAAGAAVEQGHVVVVIDYRDPEHKQDLVWAVETVGGSVMVDVTGALQVRVPIVSLLALSTHPRLEYVRLPVRPTR